jgi:Rrf2 family protein
LLKFSRASGYALQALVFLARQKDEKQLFDALHIAEPQGMPPLFLRKVLEMLASADYLQSRRGPGGGYRLARAAKNISVLEVVETVDGPLHRPVPTLEENGNRPLDRRLEGITSEAADIVCEHLGAISIADLVAKRK